MMPRMWRCERLLTIDSTQREALRRIADHFNCGEGFGLWTTHQTAGMASHGRSWRDSPHGGGLAMSFAWPESENATPQQSAWPVRISLMVLEVLQSRFAILAGRLGLKWPNDVMSGEYKLAGVLVSRHRVAERWWLIAGIGLNLGWDQDPDLDRPVTSLRNLGLDAVDAGDLVQAFAAGLSELIKEASQATPWWDRYCRFDRWQGAHVSVVHPVTGDIIAQGIHRGISAQGKLRLLQQATETEIAYGEVSLRKVAPIL
ncbi:MAG: biotin--[acetyl-CoA-carboxylase] ligase [Burkholderiaceae bacterium]|nr:biotin--[acetyl-CoA-carboxylase] ligase [Burkholderiaceae bacterium]